MALRQTKKISELPALSPASLDTTFVVGISGSTTYKISINQLTSSLDTTFATDLVTATLSGSLDGKLSTSSFNSYTASQSTSSLVNRLNAIESVSGSWITESETGSFLTSLSGAISSSTQISDLGFVTGSYTTINSFNSLTQSFNSISQSFNVISGSVVSIQGGFDTGSYQTFTTSVNTSISNLNTFTASQSTSSLVDRLNTIESVSGSWITESETGSFLTSLNGAISSSAQVIGILSSLNSVSASLISKTGSYATTGSNTFIGTEIISGSLSISGSLYLGGVEILSASLISIATGSSYLLSNLRISGSDSSLQTILTFTLPASGIWEVSYFGRSDNYNPNNGNSNTSVIYLTDSNNSILANSELLIAGDSDSNWTGGSSYKNYFITTTASTIFKLRGYGGSTSELIANGNTGVHFKKLDYYASGSQVSIPEGTISSSAQITSLGFVSGSYLTSLSGAISSSSQLTSSYDTRYALSASFVSSSNLSSIQTITSASYAALTPVSGTLYIIIG